MKSGKTLPELAAQIKKEKSEKRDFIAPTTMLEYGAFGDRGAIKFAMNGQGDQIVYPTNHCFNQICQRTGIPKLYADRMLEKKDGATPNLELLATNVNWWFQHKAEKRMLRTLVNGQHTARAFLSDRYRPLDNYDLAEAVIPRLLDAGCEVKSCEITETRLYIQAVTPRIELDLNALRESTGGDLTKVDPVQAGVVISNSEVGCGSVGVDPLIWKLSCFNGMIGQRVVRKHHVGRSTGAMAELDAAAAYYTDATRELDDKALWAKVNDVVKGVLTLDGFRNIATKFASTKDIALASPADAIEEVTNRFQLSEGENKSVLDHLIAGGDNSLFGLVNAVTRTAEDVESYDRAIELERIGGQIIELPSKLWSNN